MPTTSIISVQTKDDAGIERHRHALSRRLGLHVELATSATTQWNEYLMVAGSMLGVRFLQGTSVTLRYFRQDKLGSVAVLTDANGSVFQRDAYDAWGKRRFFNDNERFDPQNRELTIRGFIEREMLSHRPANGRCPARIVTPRQPR